MSVKNIFEKILLATFVVCWLAASGFAQKKQIRVAAAADLQTVMPEIARAYETRAGTNVQVVYGSSGNFYAQIRNGAPLDVFFSADNEYRVWRKHFASSTICGIGKRAGGDPRLFANFITGATRRQEMGDTERNVSVD